MCGSTAFLFTRGIGTDKTRQILLRPARRPACTVTFSCRENWGGKTEERKKRIAQSSYVECVKERKPHKLLCMSVAHHHHRAGSCPPSVGSQSAHVSSREFFFFPFPLEFLLSSSPLPPQSPTTVPQHRPGSTATTPSSFPKIFPTQKNLKTSENPPWYTYLTISPKQKNK